MKKLVFVLCAVLFAGAGYVTYPSLLRYAFNVSGTIEVSPRLARLAAKPNTVCFIVVKNTGDVPVAIHRIVNPAFPMEYRVTSNDLLLPKPWNGPLNVEVQINHHGRVGKLEAGDMLGRIANPVNFYARNVNVTVDRMMEVPTLQAKKNEDKGQAIFSFSAR